MADFGVLGVDEFTKLLLSFLDRAERIKQLNAVEPPLSRADLGGLFNSLEEDFYPADATAEQKKRTHAVVETAVRDVFDSILATTPIDMPSFVKIWNLFDIIAILSDDDQCDPALLFWLIEELLDSQTVAGCRKIFDYLESRREKITSNHWAQKHLVILRSCNELLRRLSRAEDPAFCGRVFIFLFQSFPLGDRSSVNLRGDYHIDHVTTFDQSPPQESEPSSDKMDVDAQADSKSSFTGSRPVDEPNSGSKGVTFSKVEPVPISVDKLYPIFWSLQESFNQPTKLFTASHFEGFKAGLEATMTRFKLVQTEMNGRSLKVVDEGNRGTKRKRSQGDEDLANTFNPKYLTSRDLFELEISDLSFRRHILVQVLIVLDFILSLSPKAKEKLATIDNKNKSVTYTDQSLNEEDTKWAIDMKKTIGEYLKQGFEGPYFFRMVETVLSRDKNWARWKIENCPSIARPSISPEEYLSAKASARKLATNKRLRPNPLGSLDLRFLSDNEGRSGLERLKDPSRYQVPSINTFKSKIELDEMDINMAREEEAKNTAIEARASKTWRALRIASTTKLTSFDKIERADTIHEVFEERAKTEEPTMNGDVEVNESMILQDRRPIVISGPSGVGKGTLITMLMDNHSKALAKKASHTTRPPREGEVNGQHYHFVTKEEYDVLRDGDQFLELNNFNGNDYGTSRKIVEGILAQGKVPVMEMDMHGIQQLKDQGYDARFIFLQPPDMSELSQRLRRRGSDDEDKIKARLEIAEKELEQAKVEGFHDRIFVNDDLQKTYEKLESYIFGREEEVEAAGNYVEEVTNTEVEMTDDPGAEGDAVKEGLTGGAETIDTPAEEKLIVEEKEAAVDEEEIVT